MTEDRVIGEINALNQRGGRMLSAIDLVAAGTLDLKLAAYLMRTVRAGASILGCAGPGGTGKTTLMGSLLCFLPANASIKVVEKSQPLSWYEEQRASQALTWFLCHELGPGPWYSYLWGEGARTFLSMPDKQRFCATTVHADNLGELRRLLQGGEIGLLPQDFARLDLVLFIRAIRTQGTGRWRRRITEVYLATGDPKEAHRSICRWDPKTDRFIWQCGEMESRPTVAASEQVAGRPWLSTFRPQPEKTVPEGGHIPVTLRPYHDFLRKLQEKRINALEDVRGEVVRFYRTVPIEPRHSG